MRPGWLIAAGIGITLAVVCSGFIGLGLLSDASGHPRTAVGDAGAPTSVVAPDASGPDGSPTQQAVGAVDATTTASPAPQPSATVTPTPTVNPTPAKPTPTKPAPNPTQKTTPKPTPKPPTVSLCGAPKNPWGLTDCSGGSTVYQSNLPSGVCSVFDCIGNFPNGKGYMEECVDHTYTMSGGRSGACSYHGGEWRQVHRV